MIIKEFSGCEVKRKSALHIMNGNTVVRTQCHHIMGRSLYIPGILTSYPSANIIGTQHMVGKGKNKKELLTGNLHHTELG